MYKEIRIADFRMPPFKASNGTRRLREHSLDRFPVCGGSSDRMLKQCRPQGLPDRNAGNASACAQLAHPGRGHRPCHSATLILGAPGAQSPRPAPAPPPAGASRPPGRALACGVPGPAGLRGTVPHGRGKRSAFPGPARRGNPFPRIGKVFPADRRSDCFFSTLLVLLPGGEVLVRGASALARRAGLSPLLIGLTVVGFGTSAPELLVSVDAALEGAAFPRFGPCSWVLRCRHPADPWCGCTHLSAAGSDPQAVARPWRHAAGCCGNLDPAGQRDSLAV